LLAEPERTRLGQAGLVPVSGARNSDSLWVDLPPRPWGPGR